MIKAVLVFVALIIGVLVITTTTTVSALTAAEKQTVATLEALARAGANNQTTGACQPGCGTLAAQQLANAASSPSTFDKDFKRCLNANSKPDFVKSLLAPSDW